MTPIATYRLQLRPGFGFAEAGAVVPYLAKLGVSHVYLSPFLQAAPGSTHGYDVVDPGRANDELGGNEGYAQLCAVLRRYGLGQILDVVPNHMSIASPEHNPWWWDVLENGPASRYASYFDVDWSPPEDRLRNRILVPILGDHYGRVLAAGDIRLQCRGAAITVVVYDRQLPVAPISLAGPLGRAASAVRSARLGFLADAFASLPAPASEDAGSRQRRQRDRAILGEMLAGLVEAEEPVAAAIESEVQRINGDRGELHELLEMQNYRLAYWRTARSDLDYRRFFDINELAALRIEDPIVFSATHETLLGWASAGDVDGLRIDHPDGLRDPLRYFERLRERAPRLWIVAEKILAVEETLPASWPIQGTTGYDFLNRVGGLFVAPEGGPPLDRCLADFLGDDIGAFADLAVAKKRQVLRELLASDLARLTQSFVGVCEASLETRDHTRDRLREALVETLVRMPVYRTYVGPDGGASPHDAAVIDEVTREAAAHRPDLDADMFAILAASLRGADVRDVSVELRGRFQQLSGTVMAKGVEDTAFFAYPRLVCLNEVGGEPDCFGTTVDGFHAHCARVQRDWPETMTTLTTHDTKRSEDARLRIAAISEVPDRWSRSVGAWSRHNRRRHVPCDAVDRATEYLLYQTLVAAWPIDAERLTTFLRKAVREAKTHTSWLQPNPEYEEAVLRFACAVIGDRDFVAMLEEFLASILAPARVHSLSQRLLQLCAPGVPDIYQGCEFWDDSLTDPDNRRSVDFAKRSASLDRWRESRADPRDESPSDEAKLWLIAKTLEVRRRRIAAFGATGSYAPMFATGRHAARVVAFVRGGAAIVVAPRLLVSFDGDWGDTRITLPAGEWSNAFDEGPALSGSIPVEELWRRFPCALLERSG